MVRVRMTAFALGLLGCYNARARKQASRAKKGMFKRVITSIVGVPLAFLVILYPGGLLLGIALALIAAVGIVEFYGGARRVGARPVEWAGMAAAVAFVVVMRNADSGDRGASIIAVLAGLVLASLLVELARRKRGPVVDVGATVFGVVYVGLLLGFVVVLRQRAGLVRVWGYEIEAGAAAVLFMFLCTWTCDTSAYFVGRFYGRTKLAPKLSPGKTVEGAIAGVVCTVLAAVLFGLPIHIPAAHALALGLVVGIVGQLGDLSESAIKRELAIKDFGTIVPGHGGVLDRFDSMLFIGPTVYYYFTLFMKDWPG